MSGMWVRVKDGIFIGGERAAEDLDWALENKVTRIVNCCRGEVDNHWEDFGVSYLSYSWEDDADQVILDRGDFVADGIFDFIEGAMDRSEGVLIHSVKGQSRSCCVLAAYMMKKYRWNLQKTMQLLDSRQLEPRLNPGFLEQLASYEERLGAQNGPLGADWEDKPGRGGLGCEVLLLRNTYLNTRPGAGTGEDAAPGPSAAAGAGARARRHVAWPDGGAGTKALLEDQVGEQEWREMRAGGQAAAAAPPVHGQLQGCQGQAASPTVGGPHPAAAAGTIPIRTQSGIVHCRPEDIECRRLGLKFRRSAIILEYVVPASGLRAHHVVRVDLGDLSAGNLPSGERGDARCGEGCALDAATAERLQKAHGPWLAAVSVDQLAALVGRLRSAAAAPRAGGHALAAAA